MKKLIYLGLFTLFSTTIAAQKHVYDDLLILYVDEEYEKCVTKAERYTENDRTRKDPLPYLYLSKCYHEMSKREEFTSQDEYKKADREALKYAVKFRKKDKELEYFNNHEDYWMELNKYAMDAGMNHYEQGDYSKARMIFSRMVGYDPKNPGAWQMLALCQANGRMMRDAKESMEMFHKTLAAAEQEDAELNSLRPGQRKLVKNALIEYSEYLTENGMQDSARVVLDLGIEHFEDDPEYKMLYKELH